jgi:plasmid stability protein
MVLYASIVLAYETAPARRTGEVTMPTLTIRKVPRAVIARVKSVAERSGRSMEQEVRELLERRYARRQDILKAIRTSWRALPPSSAKEVARWIDTGRR